jgi:hypothetical protein
MTPSPNDSNSSREPTPEVEWLVNHITDMMRIVMTYAPVERGGFSHDDEEADRLRLERVLTDVILRTHGNRSRLAPVDVKATYQAAVRRAYYMLEGDEVI